MSANDRGASFLMRCIKEGLQPTPGRGSGPGRQDAPRGRRHGCAAAGEAIGASGLVGSYIGGK